MKMAQLLPLKVNSLALKRKIHKVFNKFEVKVLWFLRKLVQILSKSVYR